MKNKVHDLKILKRYFVPVLLDLKKSEVRFNDRQYAVGDFMRLKEITGDGEYTGRYIFTQITHIEEYMQRDNYVVLSFNRLGRNIRDVRLKKGMTLEEFTEQFDDPKPSASIISRWERGISIPNPKRLKRLSEISGIGGSE